ncbi:MAG: (d)CMP kinase [Lachnospiraceae bacterium]|jgi:cytidylate kinase
MSINIAIDGPAGAGKSTLARKLAGRIGFIYVDTGALYRAIALYVINENISPEDAGAMEKALGGMRIELKYIGGKQHVLLNGEDVSGKIRTEQVSAMASVVSSRPAVRARLLDIQRDIAKADNVVMDGRDIGTAVLPDADVKIYLTASTRVRAQRRYQQLIGAGEKADLSEIEEEIRRRDERDMTRKTAPLRKADDAVLLDTSRQTPDESLQALIEIINGKIGRKMA